MTAAFIIVVLSTAALLAIMVTSPFWGWRLVRRFAKLKDARQRLGNSERVESRAMPLSDFVQKKQYGNKVVIYHHLEDSVQLFLGQAARSALQHILIFGIVIATIVTAMTSSAQASEGGQLVGSFVGVLGATDVVATLLFLQEMMFVSREVARYEETIASVV